MVGVHYRNPLGPAFHTGTFMTGYNDGFDACSDGNGGSSSPSGTSKGNGGGGTFIERDDNDRSGSESGYRLTVDISEWPFGSEDIKIRIETANGYIDRATIGTAVSGTPSYTFNIPPNEGDSVRVCVDPEGVFAFGKCEQVTTNGRDKSVSLSAR